MSWWSTSSALRRPLSDDFTSLIIIQENDFVVHEMEAVRQVSCRATPLTRMYVELVQFHPQIQVLCISALILMITKHTGKDQCINTAVIVH